MKKVLTEHIQNHFEKLTQRRNEVLKLSIEEIKEFIKYYKLKIKAM